MAKKASFQIDIGAKDRTGGKLGNVKKAIIGLAGAWIGLQGLSKLKDFVSGSITAFGQQEQSLKKVGAVLESTGNRYGWTVSELAKMATAMQKVTAIGDEEILSAQALGLTFTDIGKDIFPAFIKSAADMSQAMGTGMRDAILQLGKAIQDPDLGVSALARVGVNTAQLKAKFTDAMPIQEKQRLIIEEITTEFGGMAEAMGDTVQGRMTRMKNMFGDMQEKIGGAIVETDAFRTTMTFMEDKIEDVTLWLETNKEVIADYATVVLTALRGIADGLYYTLKGVGEFLAAWKELWGGEIKQSIQDQEEATQHMLNMQKRYKEQLDKNILSKDEYLEKMANLREETYQVRDETERTIAPMVNFGDAIKGVAGGGKDAARSFEEWSKHLQKVKDLISYEEFLGMIEPLKELQPVLSTIGRETEEVGRAFSDTWVPGIREVSLNTDDINVKWLEFQETMRYATFDFTSSWADNVIDSIWAGNFAFAEFVKGFISGMAKMILKMLAFKALRMMFGIPFGEGGAVPMRFQTGGYVPGGAPYTDRIPAWLSPKEGVLNHLGMRMVGGEEGLNRLNRGDTFNNDMALNINVSGAGDPNAVSAAVMNAIRKELPAMTKNMRRRGQS